jgi:hypothetical protein
MTRAPEVEIALSLKALAVAMKAKAGVLRDIDRLGFLRDVLILGSGVGNGSDWLVIAADFEALVMHDAGAAGAALHDWLIERGSLAGGNAERIEAALEGAIGPLRHFAWMDRVDING